VGAQAGDGGHDPLRDAPVHVEDGAVDVEGDDEPVAVVQGLDKQVDWSTLSEGAFALTHWANWLPGVTSIPTVASPLAGTVTLLLEKETLTPLPFQSVELPVKRPPEMFSDRA